MKTIGFSILFLVVGQLAWSFNGVRPVTSTSCKVVPVDLAVGMTTQIIFEQEPKMTLFADQTHFKVVTNASSPRSLAIIPVITPAEIDSFRLSNGRLPDSTALAKSLTDSFKTNLFVFFDGSNQLMFELRFVDKKKADYVIKVKQIFNQECSL